MSKSEELIAQRKKLNEQIEEAIKEEKQQAVKDVKEMIEKYSISKGDLRGKTMNILNGKKTKK